MTSYGVVYDRFLAKCTDYDLPKLSDDDLKAILHSWMVSAIAKYRGYVDKLSKRDDVAEVFNDDLTDINIEVLALLMIAEWLSPQINSALLTNQVFTESEVKYYSQANHLDSLIALRDNCCLEAKKLMRDYTYENNEYLS